MGAGAPGHAVKFMARVDEERVDEAAVVLRESVAPGLRERGFREVGTVSGRLQAVASHILRRRLEDASVEAGYAEHTRALHVTLGMRGHWSHVHNMLRLGGKGAYPAECALARAAVS